MAEGIVPFRHMADIGIAREIGGRIRAAREAAGISQRVLGSRMGRTQTAISYWEGGQREIGVCDLLRIAAVLEVPPVSLLPGGEVRDVAGLPARSQPVTWEQTGDGNG